MFLAVIVPIIFIIVIVVVVVWDVQLTREKAVRFWLAGRAVSVIEDEFATSEEWLCRCLPVWCSVRSVWGRLGIFLRGHTPSNMSSSQPYKRH